MRPTVPLILFGACDRHNFGDLLFPHIAAALQPDREIIIAGLAARDLTPDGGHRVAPLAQLAGQWRDRPVEILHVGGEILTCDAWQAAVMLQPPAEAQAAIAHYEQQPALRQAWVEAQIGIADRAPYTVARARFPHATRVAYQAVGGVALDACDPALRTEVVTKLGEADDVNVRDLRTQAQLAASGIHAELVPDPATRVAELFGAEVRRHIDGGEVAGMRCAFPQGYLAIQFSADFGDDATLAGIAAQLDGLAAATGLGMVFFRAGAAPWHDDLEVYRRTVGRMRAGAARLFASLHLWDICALIAASRGYCGSSLHGRIVAAAYALPRVSLIHPGQAGRPTKQAAYAETWEPAGMNTVVSLDGIEAALRAALSCRTIHGNPSRGADHPPGRQRL